MPPEATPNDGIPSFGDDLPNQWSPGQPESAVEATTAEPTPAPAAAPAAPATAAPPASDGFERWAAMENARKFQEAQQAQTQQAWQEWQQLQTPPPLPTDKAELDKLVLNADELAKVLRKQNEWAQRNFQATQNAILQTRQEVAQAFQQGHTQAAATATRAVEVSQEAARVLADEGYSDADIRAGMALTDQALQGNPQSYAAARLDPNAFSAAVAYTLRSRGVRPTPGARVASGGGIGYSPSAPSQTVDPRAQPVRGQALAAAERALGVKITAEDLANAGLARVS